MRTVYAKSALLGILLWPAACSIHERDLGEPSANASSRAGGGGIDLGPRGDARSLAGAGGASKYIESSQDGGTGAVSATNQSSGDERRATGGSSCGALCGGAFAVGATTVTAVTTAGGTGGIAIGVSGSDGLGSAGVATGASTLSSIGWIGTVGGATSGGTTSGGTTSGGTTSGGTASGGTASGGTASGGTATTSSSSFSGCTIGQQPYPKAHVNVDNPCQICDPTQSTTHWTLLEEGASCGAAGTGKICHERVCQAGCWIQGAYRSSGESRSASEPCKSCQPQLSVSEWSNTPEGTRCGNAGGQFCSAGACRSGCWIDKAYRVVGELDPNSRCRSCNPANDQAWTRGPSCVTSMVAGNDHTCALLDAATLKCWGNNASGQLGNASLDPSPIPVSPAAPVSGSLGRIKAVATGHEHTCVVLEAGMVWCWGNNGKGQLGNSSAGALELRPVRAGSFENAQAIAAGFEHTCVVRLGGSVECWGSNTFGQVGRSPASNEPVTTPHQVPNVNGARGVVAGANHTCAILQDSTIRCWGNGTNGQLGDGFSVDRPSPVNPSLSNVSILGAGSTHTCVVLTSGSVQCWGYNGFGQLGIDGERPFEDKVTATLVEKLSGPAVHVAAGTGHTCVALAGGNAQCFGRDSYWQLGDDADYADKGEPVNVILLTHALQVAAGRDHSCATLSNGAVRCWGRNLYGQLGNNSFDDSFEPVNVVGL